MKLNCMIIKLVKKEEWQIVIIFTKQGSILKQNKQRDFLSIAYIIYTFLTFLTPQLECVIMKGGKV